MKKAVLSNRILLSYDDELYEKLKPLLTYTIPPKMRNQQSYKISNIKRIGRKIISIPSGRPDLIPKDYTIVDKRTDIPVDFPEFQATLRPSQQEIYDKVTGSCLISANPSWGKTFTSLAIAAKLSQKTLVVTHTINLRTQWEKEIEKVFGFTPGIIGGGLYNIHKLITVSNIQTLRTSPGKIASSFGTVIVDECHHTPAKTFYETLNVLKAKNKIGLSATLQRKDNLHIVMPDYFSHEIFYTKEENQLKAKVLLIKSGIPLEDNPLIPWGIKLNNLVENPNYFNLITDLAESYAKRGEKVLVVCPRVSFIDKCWEKHRDMAYKVHGGVKDEEREAIHKEMEFSGKNILYGSTNIYSEGISLNYLSVVILATPTSNPFLLKQIVGRVTRKYKDKEHATVVDIQLDGGMAKNQTRERTAFYMDQDFDIEYIEL